MRIRKFREFLNESAVRDFYVSGDSASSYSSASQLGNDYREFFGDDISNMFVIASPDLEEFEKIGAEVHSYGDYPYASILPFLKTKGINSEKVKELVYSADDEDAIALAKLPYGHPNRKPIFTRTTTIYKIFTKGNCYFVRVEDIDWFFVLDAEGMIYLLNKKVFPVNVFLELVSLVGIEKLGNFQLISNYLHQFRGILAGKKFDI